MGKFLFLVKWLNSAKLTTTLRMEEGMSMTPEVSQYWQHFIEQQQLPPIYNQRRFIHLGIQNKWPMNWHDW